MNLICVHRLLLIMQWLLSHPEFISNPIYIAGDSFSGMIVPVVAEEIAKGGDISNHFSYN